MLQHISYCAEEVLMKLDVQIDPHIEESIIRIIAKELNEDIQKLIRLISEPNHSYILGSKEHELSILEPTTIIRIFSESGKVYAKTDSGEYLLRLRLYELDEQLDKRIFVRISNSEIINLKKVKSFDLNFTGTICVHLKNGDTTFVSRRYVSKIKKVLGI